MWARGTKTVVHCTSTCKGFLRGNIQEFRPGMQVSAVLPRNLSEATIPFGIDHPDPGLSDKVQPAGGRLRYPFFNDPPAASLPCSTLPGCCSFDLPGLDPAGAGGVHSRAKGVKIKREALPGI